VMPPRQRKPHTSRMGNVIAMNKFL
jgi:hypothetical protein